MCSTLADIYKIYDVLNLNEPVVAHSTWETGRQIPELRLAQYQDNQGESVKKKNLIVCLL